jgi:tetratricopeptide (TPR) repeat protein
MNVFANRKTRALIFIMCALVLGGVIITHFYYKSVNASIDPRIVPARKLYENYNLFARENKLDSIFWLMDTIESIYTRVEHYKNSYEVGVLYNNRAAACLSRFINEEDVTLKDSLLEVAHESVNISISIYENWLMSYDGKSQQELETVLKADFLVGLKEYDEADQQKFLHKRIKEIIEAQVETKRRLSVSYTNLGLVYRHQLRYEAAALSYQKAIENWDRNLTAENNLNKLLGRPEKKRNLIQTLFPPERVEN